MSWLWLGIAVTCIPGVAALLGLIGLHFYLRWKFLDYVVRVFQERPLFVITRGRPVPGAEEVRFPTTDGLTLGGCYLRAPGPRKGVILFGPEFGSDRWSCLPYCQPLVEAGYDVFAFEPRNQGGSDRQAGYDPLQWVTASDVADMSAALAYLKGRPDADPRGVGLFGISKGGSAGLFVAAADPAVHCCVVDSVYATYTVMVPYMRKWVRIYNTQYFLQGLFPAWYFGLVAREAIRRVARERGVRYVDLEPALRRLRGRPVLMIHGGGDTYIKPDMAQALFARVKEPKEFWLIPGAKHNQGYQTAADYHPRVRAFFDQHLSAPHPKAVACSAACSFAPSGN